MKKKILLLVLLLGCISINAQKYLRYHMNKNIYNGFYTNGIDKIIHDNTVSIIHSWGKIHEIAVADIDSITIESANIVNGDIGDYRLYELNYDNGNIKKMYIDNRAFIIASHNGDFGANDIVLLKSAYNNIEYLFYTDDEGNVRKFFDGERLFYFDYIDGTTVVIDLSTGEAVKRVASKRIKASTLTAHTITNPLNRYQEAVKNALGMVGNSALDILQNIDYIQNNPELHNEKIILDGLSITLDIVEIGAAFAEGIPTGGLGWLSLGNSINSLFDDITRMVNDIYPNQKQMEIYKKYYQEKYSINISANSAQNISYNKANLCGGYSASKNLNGTFSFLLYKGGDNFVDIVGTKQSITDTSGTVIGEAIDLKPNTLYFYSMTYNCTIDGLDFSYVSNNVANFKTNENNVKFSVGVSNVDANHATLWFQLEDGYLESSKVRCWAKAVPNIYGYGIFSDYSSVTVENVDEDSGKNNVTLNSLIPGCTYNCYFSYFDSNAVEHQFGNLQITTKMSSCPDSNHPHLIDLGLPSGTLWACCNVGASEPTDEGGFYAYGEVEEKKYYGPDSYQYGWLNTDPSIRHPYLDSYVESQESGKSGYFIASDIGDISGTSKDVAYSKWGSAYRIPTKEQMEELMELYTNRSYTYFDTIYNYSYDVEVGRAYAGYNGNTIYIPMKGYKDRSLLEHGEYTPEGRYWLSTPPIPHQFGLNGCVTSYGAYYGEFRPYNPRVTIRDEHYRYRGYNVRPVKNMK